MEKKFQLKTWAFVRIFQPHFELHFFLIFFAEDFFQRPLENFLWTLRPCSRYLKGFSNLADCVSIKIVTTRHTKRIIWQEKQKNWDFDKWSSKWGWNILTFKSIFESGPQIFGPRDSWEGVLSPNKCHHVLSRILFDLRIHCGVISNTIHKYF